MNAGHFVGRIGGLAFALGVGAAVLVGAQSASADEESGGGSSESSAEAGAEASDSTADDSTSASSRFSVRSSSDDDDDSDDSSASDDPSGSSPTQSDSESSHRDEGLESELPLENSATHEVDEPRELDGTGYENSSATSPSSPENDDSGGVAAPMPWAMVAAARREVAGDDAGHADNVVSLQSAGQVAAEPEPTLTAAVATSDVRVVGTLASSGLAPTPPVITPDGTRAVSLTSAFSLFGGMTTRVRVIDTATGRQVGSTQSLLGAPRYYNYEPLVSADGSRVVITTSVTGWFSSATTRVTVINTATGRRVGSTVRLSGNQPRPPVMNIAGTRAVITTSSDDLGTSKSITRIAVIDSATGARIGDTVTLVGSPTVYPTSSPVFNVAGTRALVLATVIDPSAGTGATRVATIDTTTGKQVGPTLILGGGDTPEQVTAAGAYVLFGSWRAIVDTETGVLVDSALIRDASSLALTNDGTRALITTHHHDDTTGAETAMIAAVDTASGNQVGATVTLNGIPANPPVLSADGTRAVFAATDDVENAIEVAVIDTVTGNQIGTTTTLTGRQLVSLSTAAGGRVVISAVGGGLQADSTLVSVIDTATGTLIGTTASLAGSPAVTPVLNAAGTRAVIVTTSFDSVTGASNARVAVFDTATGTQVGTSVTFADPRRVFAAVSVDGTRALITLAPTDFTTGGAARVAVIDTATGTQMGTTVTIAGIPSGPAMFVADGARVVFTTHVYDPGTRKNTTRVAVIDPLTGAQVGSTFSVTSTALSAQVLSADGTRVMVTTASGNLFAGTTRVAAIDTLSGAQSAATSVTGYESAGSLLSADGKRAVITAYSWFATRVAILRIA